MKKIELVLIGFVVLALIIRFFHLPYSEELTTYSLKFISVVYLYFGFALFNNIELKNIIKKDSYQTISKNRIFGGIVTGIALAITVNGISFKFQ
jgi:branched-subunit amino acid transport protein